MGASPLTVKSWLLACLLAFGSIAPSQAAENFSACPQFFAHGVAPEVKDRPLQRALCYDAFAILHSGESKTPVFVAERLNRAAIADTGEKRTNRFYAEAKLRSAERATPEDYKGSGFDRGHMAPAGDMPTAQAMAQSFSLANMVPQAPEHNRSVWAKTVESSTRKYASRAIGDIYVITGPVYVPSIVLSPPALARDMYASPSTCSSWSMTSSNTRLGPTGMKTPTPPPPPSRSATQSW